jgi:hypothetical protein
MLSRRTTHIRATSGPARGINDRLTGNRGHMSAPLPQLPLATARARR